MEKSVVFCAQAPRMLTRNDSRARSRTLWVAMLLLCFCVSFPLGSVAQPGTQQPVAMEADNLGVDQDNGIVVAMGNVEVVQGDYILFADRITYYQKRNVVRADGNVSVLEPTGNVYFADQVNLRDDLKRGVIEQFKVRLVDNSVFVAAQARKESDTKTVLKQAAYTPCMICEGDENPAWQMRAKDVTVDEVKQKVTYKNAWLEVYGLPVAYTPYFSHPTPNADRKSGFLSGENGQTSNLGTVVRLPYYWNIAPNKDATITPIFTSEEGPVLETEYRHLFETGELEFMGSITFPEERDDQGVALDDREVRGHVFSRGNWAIDEDWRWGFDVNRSSDDTYLRRYNYGWQESLTSRAFIEGAHGRNYALAEGLLFQGLRADDDQDVIPAVLPMLQGYYETKPGWQGSQLFVSGNARALSRDEGARSQRLSTTAGAKLPIVTSGGHVIEATAQLRTDVYAYQDVEINSRIESGSEQRLIPQAAINWRYPLVKQLDNASLTVEPQIVAVASGRGNNPLEIVNEDSLVSELSELNLFAINPFPGLDLVDEGSRIAYGVTTTMLYDGGQSVSLMLGQNYSEVKDTLFPYNDDPNEHFSDYLMKLDVDYDPVALSYFTKIDEETLDPNRHEVFLGYSNHPVNFIADYLMVEDDPFIEDREELGLAASWQFLPNWTIDGFGRRDLTGRFGTVVAGGGLTYTHDCFTIFTNLRRDYVSDRDLEEETSFNVRVALKNLN